MPSPAAGKAYFIADAEPVSLWEWINGLLRALGEPPITRRIPLGLAYGAGLAGEVVWGLLRLKGMPPMTRFVAAELAKDHWFNIGAARRDLGYNPSVGPAEGLERLVASLKSAGRNAA